MNTINIHEVSLSRAVEYFKQGRLDEAQSLFLSILSNEPKNPDAIYFMGMIDHQCGRTEVAEHRANELIKLKPTDAKAINLIGTILLSQKKLPEAADYFRKGIKYNKDNPLLHVNAAICSIGEGNPDRGIELCRIAIKIDARYVNAYNILGTAYLGKSDFTHAAESFEKALELNPDLPDVRFNLGKAKLEMGDLETAMSCFDHIVDTSLHKAFPLTGKADIFSLQKNYSEAEIFYQQALAENPNFGPAFSGLGKINYKSGKFNAALSYFKRAIELNPANLEALIYTGDAFRQLGKNEAAEAAFSDALKVDPDNSQARFHLAAVQNTAPPAKPDNNYIRQLFDEFSDTFDKDIHNIEYDAPAQLAKLAKRHLKSSDTGALDTIDLGCGTGLCGVAFKDIASNLKGIDISPKMIDAARKRGLYSELEVNEILTALVKHQNDTDLILSADVFPYIGDLESTFLAVHSALRKNGLFLFTVESHAGEDSYRLSASTRYSHTQDYLINLAKRRDMEVLSCEESPYRKQAGEPIDSLIVALRKAS
ncbi:MAG: tetratricopeptide repeat protein [Methylococcaceae bacterium]